MALETEVTRTLHMHDHSQVPLPLDMRTLEAINLPILVTDLQGHICQWNASARKQFDLHEVKGEAITIDRLTEDAYRPLLRPAVLKRLLEAGSCEIEPMMQTISGFQFPAGLSGTLVMTEDSSPSNILFTCRDISLRREAIRRSREVSQRLAFHVRRTPLVFLECDMDYQIIAWNKAAERIFGWTEREIIGQPVYLLVEQEFREGLDDIFQRLINKEGGERSTNRNVTKDGRTIVCEWYNTPMFDEHANPIGIACLGDDITDRIRMEEELRLSRSEAVAANHSKDEFLALMNHEVRTPMNSIVGFSDLLLDEARDSEYVDSIQTIKDSAIDLLALINDVLTYSRLDSGKMFLEMRETDIEHLIYELKELNVRHIEEKQLGLVLEIDPEVPKTVFTDHNELRNLLGCLLDNAIKFSERGEVKLSISGNNVSEDAGSVWLMRFAVSDEGIGIPHEKQLSIFDAFSQLEPSSTRRHGGSGLGLSISRKIVDLLGGNIEVESAVGKGSTFICNIPMTAITETELPESSGAKSNDVIAMNYFADFFPARILIFTRSASEKSNGVVSLTKMGYRPEIVDNMRQLKAKLMEQFFDVVIFETQVSEVILAQSFEHIQRSQKLPGGRTYIAVAEHRSTVRKAPFPPGLSIDRILSKPIRQVELQSLLRSVAVASRKNTGGSV